MRSRHPALLALALAGALAFSTTPAHAGRKAVKPPTTYWSRGDTATDPSAFYRDEYDCIKENPVGPYRTHLYRLPENERVDQAAKAEAVHAANQMVNLCLRARGYVLRQGPDGTVIP